MRLLAACAFLVFSLPGWAHTEPLSRGIVQFKNAVDGLLAHPCLKSGNFGIEVYSLDKRETVYSRKNDQLFIPASNLKLLTTAVALKTLGPNYRFPTRIYSSAPIQDGVLKGDLYINKLAEKFGGGGHRKAAGVTLHDLGLEEAAEKIVTAIKEYMG